MRKICQPLLTISVSTLSRVSRQTVKERIHALEFPLEKDKLEQDEKRAPQYLFIDADEDHDMIIYVERSADDV